MSRTCAFGPIAALCLVLFACDDDGIGSPCESATDCDIEAGQICDIHDGLGTCQEDHDHGEDEDSDTESSVCAQEARGDHFAVGLSRSGELVRATFVSAAPAPPAMGDNTWVLNFTDADGLVLDELGITVTPTMPDHGHGSSVAPVVSATGNPGEYSVASLDLYMEGYWEVAFALELAEGGAQDSLSFGFCVE
ncbi:FixH family protein [Pseudenhygromyxa sp. WMMC2535]|uniref:FixH family protein n=1 Tax=Pseudenhygromyxa sp. WMMC2535 TaxID=2712867 RepID=UPI001552891A|nr:FixH family protein [Pseudenhygromyxa sp. WMMC2535]NVB40415.1 FixH family protein [Pseudenhygromyxa sp. WMMC2535]